VTRPASAAQLVGAARGQRLTAAQLVGAAPGQRLTAARARAARATVVLLGILTVLAAGALVAGCSTHPQPRQPRTVPATPATPKSSNDPRTVAAAKVAVEAENRQLSGDYAGAWELYTAAGKAAISKDDFVRLQTACPPKLHGQQARATEGRLEDPNTAVIRIQVAGQTTARTMRNEGGHWLTEPSDTALADFKLGVDQAIAKQKAAGNC